jgi:hypothetical protein
VRATDRAWLRDSDVPELETRGQDLASAALRAPALAGGGRVGASIDVDEEQRRRLAMYQEGQAFSSAPPRAAATPERGPRSGRRGAGRSGGAAGDGSRSTGTYAVVALAGTALAVWLVRRFRARP